MLTRVVTVGGIVAVTLFGAPVVAGADGWGEADCRQKPTPHCQLTAGESTSPHAGSPDPQAADQQADDGDRESGNLPSCGYSASEPEGPPPGAAGWRPPGSWYQGTCSLTGVIRNPTPQLSPAEVARLARAQLGLPDPVVAANPAGTQLVNLPTWLWLADGWDAVTATASVPGVVVSATARPSSVTWAMGDGAMVACAGPGTTYRGGDPLAPSPDCGHTYRRSSAAQPGDRYSGAVTVHWSVTWAGAGQSGTFPDLTTTSSTSFPVAESPALNTLPGHR